MGSEINNVNNVNINKITINNKQESKTQPEQAENTQQIDISLNNDPRNIIGNSMLYKLNLNQKKSALQNKSIIDTVREKYNERFPYHHLDINEDNYETVNLLLDATIKNKAGEDVPRITYPTQFNDLVELREQDKESFDIIFNSTYPSSEGYEEGRFFTASDLKDLITCRQKNLEDFDAIFSATYKDANENDIPIITYKSEIEFLVQIRKGHEKSFDVIFNSMLKDKDGNEVPRRTDIFEYEDLIRARESNEESFDKIFGATIKDKDGNEVPRVKWNSYIEEYIELREGHEEAFDAIFGATFKDKDGNEVSRIQYNSEIKYLIEAKETNEESFDIIFASSLLDSDGNERPRISYYDIKTYVDYRESNPESFDKIFNYTIKDEEGDENTVFTYTLQLEALINSRTLNSELFDQILESGELSFDDIPGYIENEKNNHNSTQVKEFLKKFPNIDHNYIDLGNIIAKSENNEMLEFITSDSYMDELKKNSAGKYQNELLEILAPDKWIETYDIINLLKSGLSKEDFLNSLKKISKSTFKLAYDTPNQYLSGIDTKYSTPVNGKLPELSDDVLKEQREIIKIFFRRNLGSLTRALKYLDTDTISHMMDKRTELFAQSLKELNSLTDDNFELLSKLTKLKSAKSGKPLSPKEKIQLCQIMEIFQNVNLDKTILLEAADKGEFDIKAPKQFIQKAILESADIDPTSMNLNPEKTKFNEEYGYLALRNFDDALNSPEAQEGLRCIKEQCKQLKENSDMCKNIIDTHSEMLGNPDYARTISPEMKKLVLQIINMLKNIDNYSADDIYEVMKKTVEQSIKQYSQSNELFTVIKASVMGDFKEFINNPSNKYGQTNAETKSDFESEGLNYERWINPDIEDIQLEVAGKKMSMRMWDRNPQEDLFIGNKTTCCTAIGTGGNGGATPVYLLNTSFNVVELYDSNGNVVGMSRVFMAKTDDQPTLIMDNIELNKTYIKEMTYEEKTQIRDGFFQYMRQYASQVTGNDNSPVYFYSRDVHVPTSDLETTSKTTYFIGKLSQDTVYVNSAGCRWINPTELNEENPIEWLIVPSGKK